MTPQNVKIFFKDYLFPCWSKEDISGLPRSASYLKAKSPRLPEGNTWCAERKDKPLYRSIEGAGLFGLDCGQAGLVVVDFDSYKSDSMNEKEKARFKEIYSLIIKANSKYFVKTPSGGTHYFFRGSFPSKVPVVGCDIKGQGGYVCLYSAPPEIEKHSSFESWRQALPAFGLRINTPKKDDEASFGPGRNNHAIAVIGATCGHNINLRIIWNHLRALQSKNLNRGAGFNLLLNIEDFLGVIWKTAKKLKALSEGQKQIINSVSKSIHFLLNENISDMDKSKKALKVLSAYHLAILRYKTSESNSNIHDRIQGITDKLHVEGGITQFVPLLKAQRIKWGIQNWMPAGELTILGGDGGIGKSLLAIKLALINAKKQPFWEGGPLGDGRPSVIVPFERNRKVQKDIARFMGDGDKNYVNILESFQYKKQNISFKIKEIFNPVRIKKVNDEVCKLSDVFKNFIKRMNKINPFMVVLDPLYALMGGEENNNFVVRSILEELNELIAPSDTSWLGIMHPRKERKDTNLKEILKGSSEFTNVCQSVLFVRRQKGHEKANPKNLIQRVKANLSSDGVRYGLEYEISGKIISSEHFAPIKNKKYIDLNTNKEVTIKVEDTDFSRTMPQVSDLKLIEESNHELDKRCKSLAKTDRENRDDEAGRKKHEEKYDEMKKLLDTMFEQQAKKDEKGNFLFLRKYKEALFEQNIVTIYSWRLFGFEFEKAGYRVRHFQRQYRIEKDEKLTPF